jgi:hypothetical protein
MPSPNRSATKKKLLSALPKNNIWLNKQNGGPERPTAAKATLRQLRGLVEELSKKDSSKKTERGGGKTRRRRRRRV